MLSHSTVYLKDFFPLCRLLNDCNLIVHSLRLGTTYSTTRRIITRISKYSDYILMASGTALPTHKSGPPNGIHDGGSLRLWNIDSADIHLLRGSVMELSRFTGDVVVDVPCRVEASGSFLVCGARSWGTDIVLYIF